MLSTIDVAEGQVHVLLLRPLTGRVSQEQARHVSARPLPSHAGSPITSRLCNEWAFQGSVSDPVEHRHERVHTLLMPLVFLKNDSALDSAISRGIRSIWSPPALSGAQCSKLPACEDLNRGRYPIDSLPTKKRIMACLGIYFLPYCCNLDGSDNVHRINKTRAKALSAEKPLASVPALHGE